MLILNKNIPLKDQPIIQITEELFLHEEMNDFTKTNFHKFCFLQEKRYKSMDKMRFLAEKLKGIGKKIIASVSRNSVFVLVSIYVIDKDLPCYKFSPYLPDLYLFEM